VACGLRLSRLQIVETFFGLPRIEARLAGLLCDRET
jgi:hypothetical protein